MLVSGSISNLTIAQTNRGLMGHFANKYISFPEMTPNEDISNFLLPIFGFTAVLHDLHFGIMFQVKTMTWTGWENKAGRK